MLIGERLKLIRTTKNISQAVIEQRTGLLRCYISRVENGYTVPSVATLERLARGLGIPTYQLFYDGDEPAQIPAAFANGRTAQNDDWASRGNGLRLFTNIRQSVGRMTDKDRDLLLCIAQRMARRRKSSSFNA